VHALSIGGVLFENRPLSQSHIARSTPVDRPDREENTLEVFPKCRFQSAY